MRAFLPVQRLRRRQRRHDLRRPPAVTGPNRRSIWRRHNRSSGHRLRRISATPRPPRPRHGTACARRRTRSQPDAARKPVTRSGVTSAQHRQPERQQARLPQQPVSSARQEHRLRRACNRLHRPGPAVGRLTACWQGAVQAGHSARPCRASMSGTYGISRQVRWSGGTPALASPHLGPANTGRLAQSTQPATTTSVPTSTITVAHECRQRRRHTSTLQRLHRSRRVNPVAR